MQHVNGTNGAAAPVQINPQQAAAYGLQFLERVSHTRAERESFDIATQLLQVIASGQAILTPAQAQAVQLPAAESPPPQ